MALSRDVRRNSSPSACKLEMKWFSSTFQQPETRHVIPGSSIDVFKNMIWDNASDYILPKYGKTVFFTPF